MRLADELYGYGPAAAPRQTATAALQGAVQAITALETRLHQHPLARAWARAEREIAVAAAAAEARLGSADIELILRARMGVFSLPAGHVALSDLDARARAWEMIRQRKGSTDRRALVGALTTGRGSCDLVRLADAAAAALAQTATASFELTRAGEGARTLTVVAGSAVDAGDVALAIPYALRRLGLTRTLLPTLSGRVRTLRVTLGSSMPGGFHATGAEGDGLEDDPKGPLAALTRWAATLAAQARAGAARLDRLERYVAHVERQLILVRRPHALRRLVGVGLSSWGLWAAQLARLTEVELSSAWRTLGQAAELGIVEAIPVQAASPEALGLPGTGSRGAGSPGAGRSRGDATLYTIPPWLHLAGLAPAPRGRPAAAARADAGEGFAATAAAMDEAAAAIAELDALLARAPRAT